MKTFYDLEREVFMRNDPVALELVRAALEAIEVEADRDLEGEGLREAMKKGLLERLARQISIGLRLRTL